MEGCRAGTEKLFYIFYLGSIHDQFELYKVQTAELYFPSPACAHSDTLLA